MEKRIETVIMTKCYHCGVNILRKFVYEEQKTPEEIAKLEQIVYDEHIMLHEKANRYNKIMSCVREIEQITGGFKNDT